MCFSCLSGQALPNPLTLVRIAWVKPREPTRVAPLDNPESIYFGKPTEQTLSLVNSELQPCNLTRLSSFFLSLSIWAKEVFGGFFVGNRQPLFELV